MAVASSQRTSFNLSTAYSDFLLINSGRINTIESSLRNLSWLLPGRFQDAELASEGLYASLNLLSTYHDAVILRAADSLPEGEKPTLSAHGRYTKAWMNGSTLYRRISRLLTLLTFTQLLLEMATIKRYGRTSPRRWRLVLVIESLKALMRLSLFHITNDRPVVHPPVPEREIDPSSLEPNHTRKTIVGQPPYAHVVDAPVKENGHGMNGHGEYHGGMNGSAHPDEDHCKRVALESVPKTDAALRSWLAGRALAFDDLRRPELLVRRAGGAGKLAELLWIFRPVIYVLAIRKYGDRHAAPWTISLAIDALSRQLRNAQLRIGTHIEPVSDAERIESARRERALWWYLFRGPAWEHLSKPRLDALAKRWQGRTILGFASTLLADYVPLLDTYYYYTSS